MILIVLKIKSNFIEKYNDKNKKKYNNKNNLIFN